jgi:hypothetical protein
LLQMSCVLAQYLPDQISEEWKLKLTSGHNFPTLQNIVVVSYDGIVTLFPFHFRYFWV